MKTFLQFIQRYIIIDDLYGANRKTSILRAQIKYVCISVLLFGLIAHGYAFFDTDYTHDTLNALYADAAENTWKISLGRFFKPVYQTLIRGEFAAPWLIGMLSLIWAGLAVFVIVRLFDIQTPICTFMVSGICITNLSFSLTAATYIYDLDANMLALLLSSLAAHQWKRSKIISPLSILFIAPSLGIYQSYVSVCIVLMILVLLMDLLHGDCFTRVFKKGLSGCIALALGAAAYVLCLWIIRQFTGYSMHTGSGNSLGLISTLNIRGMLTACKNTYGILYTQLIRDWMTIFPLWAIKVTHILLMLSVIVPFWSYVKGGIGILEALLFLLLIAFIPLAVFLSMLLSGGESLHQLMLFSLWLLYLFPILLVYHTPISVKSNLIRASRLMTVMVLSVLLWGNIRTANTLYLIKDMQHESAKSLMTRVLYRMEDIEDYVPGQTPVAIIGASPMLTQLPHAERYERLVGISNNLLARSPEAAYDPQYKLLTYMLGSPINLCDDDTYFTLKKNADVIQMPLYPDNNCMQMIDGTLVIKLGH